MEMHHRMDDEITEEEFDREFARGKPVKIRVERMGSILSIRVDTDILGRLQDYAQSKGIGMTTAARQLIDEGLQLNAAGDEGLADVLERVAVKLRETDSSREVSARTGRSRKHTSPKPKAGKP